MTTFLFPTIPATQTRSVNRSAVLDYIHHNSPVARSVIPRDLQFSLPTVIRIAFGALANIGGDILDELTVNGHGT